jgi:hypothetical protein
MLMHRDEASNGLVRLDDILQQSLTKLVVAIISFKPVNKHFG